jgi:methyl-accepting chemotaxis protein
MPCCADAAESNRKDIMKSKMTIGRKLFLAFGAALALTLILSFVALQSFSSLDGQVKQLVGTEHRKLYLAGAINTAMSDIIAAERGVLLRAYMNDYVTVEKYKAQELEAADRLNRCLSEIVALLETREGRQLATRIQESQRLIAQYHSELASDVDKHDLEGGAKVYADRVMPNAKVVQDAAEALMSQVNGLTLRVGESAQASVARSRWITVIMIALSLLIGAVVIYVVRQINISLGTTIAELSEGAQEVASAASQVASSSQALARGSSAQAASLEETSAACLEIHSVVGKNTDSSRTAADLVAASQQKYIQTNQSLEKTVVAMSEINAQSGKVSKIIKTIDEIAFQTNILALNAAVEAARAGDAGMGFAVVADEVRNLAQRCAQAAKDTSVLIEESIAKSEDGKTKVDQVVAAIRVITGEAAKVKGLVDEVNAGSQEQARGIEQINKAITQMEQVTQQTAAGAEESASAAEELTAQSQSLKDVVARLTAMVGGGDMRIAGQRMLAPAFDDAIEPPHHHESTFGLAALHETVGNKTKVHASAPFTGHNYENQLPMDDDFKEF